jgi:hypothetical protein
MSPPDSGEPTEDGEDPRDRVLAPVRTARQRVETERAEVAAERRAVGAFRDRVASLSTVARTGTDRRPGTGTVTVGANAPGTDLSAVRTAYRETVMAVDHYESVYGDDLPESLAAEFGPELAVAVGDGAGGRLSPQLRSALVAAAEESRDDRAAFLDTLDGEAASLEAAGDAFAELLDRAGEAPDGRTADETALDRVESVVAGRQERLNRTPALRRTDGHDLCSYLYEGADWTYPVLVGAARLRATLDGSG